MSIIFRYFCLLDFIFIYNILKISFLSNYACFRWKILLLLSCIQVQLFCLFFNEFYWLGFLWKVLGRTICLFIYFQHFLHLVLTSVFYLAFCVLLEFLQNFILFFGLFEYTYTYFELFVWVFTSLSLEATMRPIILEKFSDLGFPCSYITVLGLLHCDLLHYLDLFFLISTTVFLKHHKAYIYLFFLLENTHMLKYLWFGQRKNSWNMFSFSII